MGIAAPIIASHWKVVRRPYGPDGIAAVFRQGRTDEKMSPAAIGIAVIVLAVSVKMHDEPQEQATVLAEQSPAEPASTEQTAAPSPGPGRWIETESYTAPSPVARCIAVNIQRKMPELQVRNQPAESPEGRGYLILTTTEPSPATFGVIRVEGREGGSHLTTWLPERSLTMAAEDLARRLVAGC